MTDIKEIAEILYQKAEIESNEILPITLTTLDKYLSGFKNLTGLRVWLGQVNSE
jgi:hypothetical protein